MAPRGRANRERVVISDDVGDERARELAERLRQLAAVDPELARHLVTELVTMLDRVTKGAFGEQLTPACRAALGLATPSVDDDR